MFTNPAPFGLHTGEALASKRQVNRMSVRSGHNLKLRSRGSACPLVLLLLCVCWAVPAYGADPQEMYRQATETLYSLDFDEAESIFLKLTEEHPDDPDYWNGLASTAWLKILYEQQKLDIESFSGQDRFGTSNSKEKVSAEDEAGLRKKVARAIAAADAILKKNPKDLRALYAKGQSNATIASFEATVKRSYWAAAGKAKAAHDLHQQVLDQDPTFYDARATVGVYNYVVASIPAVLRYTVLLPLGLRGDGKQTGIRQLEEAATKGKRATVDAKLLLIVIYNRERLYDKSLKLIDELRAKYPRNFLFAMSQGAIYGKLKRWDESISAYKLVAEKVLAHKDGYERLRLGQVYYELGNNQIHGMRFDDAAATFLRVIEGSTATPNEKAVAHLWVGKMLDGKFRLSKDPRERSAAVAHYAAVENLDAGSELKKEARKYKSRPFVSK
jgi:tetratricopeptide (TPR) repeat protein